MDTLNLSATTIEKSRERLEETFASLEIKAPAVPYPASKTVEEGKLLRGEMEGTFTKNLLLKDKKGNKFLLAVHEDRNLNLKTLHKRLDARGHLGFVAADVMVDLLGVVPGALTPLAIINDDENAVNVVIDAELMAADQLNFHPLINTESVGLHPEELQKFIRACGREPIIVDFDIELTE